VKPAQRNDIRTWTGQPLFADERASQHEPTGPNGSAAPAVPAAPAVVPQPPTSDFTQTSEVIEARRRVYLDFAKTLETPNAARPAASGTRRSERDLAKEIRTQMASEIGREKARASAKSGKKGGRSSTRKGKPNGSDKK